MYFYFLIRIYIHFSMVPTVHEALLIAENKCGKQNIENWNYMKGSSSKLSKELTLLLIQGGYGSNNFSITIFEQ